mgnify:CR=1 FL=1
MWSLGMINKRVILKGGFGNQLFQWGFAHYLQSLGYRVSLIAYDQYVASEDSDEQKKFLAEHINATKLHINQLSDKKYDNIDSTLDFTMMFIPIESAYLLAVQGDENLWSYAYSKRILLVSPTTMIACLKLFSDLF